MTHFLAARTNFLAPCPARDGICEKGDNRDETKTISDLVLLERRRGELERRKSWGLRLVVWRCRMERSIPPRITERMVPSCHEASLGVAEAAYICISRTYSMALGFGFFCLVPRMTVGLAIVLDGFCILDPGALRRPRWFWLDDDTGKRSRFCYAWSGSDEGTWRQRMI